MLLLCIMYPMFVSFFDNLKIWEVTKKWRNMFFWWKNKKCVKRHESRISNMLGEPFGCVCSTVQFPSTGIPKCTTNSHSSNKWFEANHYRVLLQSTCQEGIRGLPTVFNDWNVCKYLKLLWLSFAFKLGCRSREFK